MIDVMPPIDLIRNNKMTLSLSDMVAKEGDMNLILYCNTDLIAPSINM